VQISGANRLRVNAAAEAMGISKDEMFNMISRQAVRDRVERQMGGRFNGDAELKELVLNTATLDKNNNAVVNINGEQKVLEDITEKDKAYLRNLQKTESEDIKDIAQILRGYTDVQEGFGKEIENKKASAFSEIGKFTKKIYGKMGETNFILTIIKDAALAMTLAQTVGSFFGGIGRAIPGKAGKGGGNVGGTPGNSAVSTVATSVGGNGQTIATNYGGQYSQRTLERVSRKVGGEVIQEGGVVLGPDGNPVPEKTLKRAARTTKIAGKAASGAVGGAIAGVTTAIGYLADGSFKGTQSERNKAKGGTIGATLFGGLGTAIAGPIGAMIGAELGKFAGELIAKGFDNGRAKKKKKFTEDLKGVKGKNGEDVSEAFASLSDNYNRHQLKKIKKALMDGEITEDELSNFSKRTRKKLATEDRDLIEKHGSAEAKGRLNEEIEKMNAKIESGSFNMETGEFTVTNGNFNYIEPFATMARGGKLNGPSDINGPGMPIQGSNIVVGGGEYVVNAEATRRNEALLDRINSGETIKMAKGGVMPVPAKISNIQPNILKSPLAPLSVHATTGASDGFGGRTGAGENRMEVAPIKLDINGVVKLDAGGQQVDLNAIINNPAFLTQLSQMIERRLVDNINGGNFKELKKNKQHTF
jgi:hypothetical protein